jgi:hypothetical protein
MNPWLPVDMNFVTLKLATFFSAAILRVQTKGPSYAN